MAETRTITIECLRYNPETDSEPRYESYDVPFTDDMSVLQGLQYIKDNLDGSLTFRWSCRMAVCGSCGMMINGVPRLACETFLREFHPEGVRVEPLTHFPIVRDLVIDQSDFLAKLELSALLRGVPAVRAELALHGAGRAGAAAPLQRRLA
jgi:fumarate reductase iron-sulfur subunit